VALVVLFLAAGLVALVVPFFAAGLVAVALLAGAFLAVDVFFAAAGALVEDFFAGALVAAGEAFLVAALVAGDFLAVLFPAGAFLAADFAAPAAFFGTVTVAFLAVLFAAPTALLAEVFFLAGVFFAVEVLPVDRVVAFFCAAGTCASWSVIVRRCRRSLSRTAGAVAPAHDLGNIAARYELIHETCAGVSHCPFSGPATAHSSACDRIRCTQRDSDQSRESSARR